MPVRQPDLREPLILVIGRLGGAATKRRTLDELEKLIGDRLDAADWLLVGDKKKNEASWQNKVAWERDKLVEEGLFTYVKKNEWRLSPDGIEIYQRLEEHAARGDATAPESGLSPVIDFKPKDASDYIARTQLRVLIKSRSHEDLVTRFATWAGAVGFVASSPHPQDLVLRKSGSAWLVEAKVLYDGDASAATRAALAQLLDYRYFLHADDPNLRLVALFSEDVGAAFRSFLARHGIETVWPASGKWHSGHPVSETILRK
jgi:hypothetical protein